MGNLQSLLEQEGENAIMSLKTARRAAKSAKKRSRLLIELDFIDEGKWEEIEDVDADQVNFKEYMHKGTL